MKAAPGGYARATDVEHALSLLAGSEGLGRVIAGGQSLVAAMNMGLTGGEMLVDISHLEALRGVRDDGEFLHIGALTRHAEIGRNTLVANHAPILRDAVHHIAHAAIRNRGTIGGAVAHADPAAEFPACILALDARLHVQGPNGMRTIEAQDFFVDMFATAIVDGEILTSLSIPKAEAGERQVLEELARRSGDYALAGLCLLRRASGHRLTTFSVAPKPALATGAMAALDVGDIDGAVTALQGEVDPPSDTQASGAYRRHLVGILLRRAVERLERDGK